MASEVRKDQEDWRDYIRFPHARQAFRVERRYTDLDGSNPRCEVHYGVTSLPKSRANRRQLLALNRGHWTIENCIHWVRDVTFDEDRHQIRKGDGPRMMASLRNIAMNLIRLAGSSCIAATTRHCSHRPNAALRLVGV